MNTESTSNEVVRELRFRFGANWAQFLNKLNDDRIDDAEASLKQMLQVDSLNGESFLDIGSGSGLFSLAARRLGAQVSSFDYDPLSVACTNEVKRRYFPEDDKWNIDRGSVLDRSYMEKLGTFDIVYSWGVLHHTGAMWNAIELALLRVKPGGLLFIALYNDQVLWSRVWWILKWVYNKIPTFARGAYAHTVWGSIKLLVVLKYTILLNPMKPIREMRAYKPRRGMDVATDVIDWMGGFPFEFVRYDVIRDYLESRGFKLQHGKENSAIGCHELVFRRTSGGRDE